MQGGATSQRTWHVATIVLLVTYFTAGVFGRFPWKADEPYYFGVTWHMLVSGDWLIPRLAGQPFMEKPPLVYWLGAFFAQLVPAWPAHEAARVAVLLLVGITLAAVYACARILAPELTLFPWRNHGACDPALPRAGTYGTLAVLAIPGCLGFSEHIHKLTADLAQLAGALIALLGLVLVATLRNREDVNGRRTALVAGMLAGTGAGVAFMAKGLLVPGILACTCLLGLSIPAYRTRAALLAAAVGAIALAPWVWLWPSQLLATAPDLFNEWFYTHNVGRFVGTTQLGGNVTWDNKVKTLLTSAGPIVALCAGMLVVFARHTATLSAARAPGHRCVALYVASCVLVLGASAVLRDNYLLPLLPGLVLFGLPALYLYPSARRLKAVIDVAFAVLAFAVLLIWLGLVVNGEPLLPRSLIEYLRGILPVPFSMMIDYVALGIGACALGAWWLSTRHEGQRSAMFAWCSGVAMLWAFGITLLLPWIDAARSYHGIFTDLQAQLQGPASCVATINLGESELALFHYVTGITPTRAHLGISGGGEADMPNPLAADCDHLLVLSNRYSGPIEPCTRRWSMAWSGHRPADHRERFVLYRPAHAERALHERRHPPATSVTRTAASPFVAAGAAACRADSERG